MKALSLLLLLAVCLSFYPLPGQAQSGPARLDVGRMLPSNTLFYAEWAGGNFWGAGEGRMGLAIFWAGGDWPTGAIFRYYPTWEEARDRALAFGLMGWQAREFSGRLRGNYTLWQHPLLPFRMIQIGNWIWWGEAAALEALIDTWARVYPPLSENNPLWAHFRQQAPQWPDFWTYSGWNSQIWAHYRREGYQGVELIRQGTPPAIPPQTLDPALFEALPIGTLGLLAGVHLDRLLAEGVELIRRLAESLGQQDEALAGLGLQVEGLLRTALGVDIERELIPLAQGNYAFYLGRSPAVEGTLALGLEAGFLLAPDNPDRITFILLQVLNRLSQNFGLSFEPAGPGQFRSPPPWQGLPEVVYGVADEQYFYLGSPTAADQLLLAINGQTDLSDSAAWGRVWAAAPTPSQYLLYVNLGEVSSGAAIGALQAPAPLSSLLESLGQIEGESLALYYGQTETGLQHWRALVFD